MDTNEFISLVRLYDEILEEEKALNIKKEKVDDAHRKRIYSKKFNTLLKIFCCNKIFYKNKGKYLIYNKDAYIIKYLIMYASIETSFIGKWFNGNIDKFSSKNIVEFYEDLEAEFNILVKEKKTDLVRVREWLSAINTIIDYSTSKRIMQIEILLENFRLSALPLNHHIHVGEIVYENFNGDKEIALAANEIEYKNDSKNFYATKHYMDALYLKINEYNKEIEKKSYEMIKLLTEMKITFNASGTSEDYLDHNKNEIASAYVLRDYNIQRYLNNNLETKKKLEDELEIEDISKYYNIISK